MVFPVDDGLGVPGDADAVDLSVLRVHRHQDVGVASAVAVVHTGDQNGVKIVLSLRMGGQGGGCCGGLRVGLLLLGGGVLLVVLGLDFRRPEEAVHAGVYGGGYEDDQKQGPAPTAPAASLGHMKILLQTRRDAAVIRWDRSGQRFT